MSPVAQNLKRAKNRKHLPDAVKESLGIPVKSLLLLRDMGDSPLPRTGGPCKSPAGKGMHLGPLIRLGYARYDADTRAYVPTDKGCDFISRLKATGLLDEK